MNVPIRIRHGIFIRNRSGTGLNVYRDRITNSNFSVKCRTRYQSSCTHIGSVVSTVTQLCQSTGIIQSIQVVTLNLYVSASQPKRSPVIVITCGGGNTGNLWSRVEQNLGSVRCRFGHTTVVLQMNCPQAINSVVTNTRCTGVECKYYVLSYRA